MCRLGTRTLADYDGKMPEEEPPDHVKEQYWRVGNALAFPLGSPEYAKTMTEISDYNAERMYHMGVVGLAPKLFIANKDIRNIPDHYGADAE